jgi:hypothetical protein
MVIRAMEKEDLDLVSLVHSQAFIRQRHSLEWIECNYRAFPRMQYFVAQEEGCHAYQTG